MTNLFCRKTGDVIKDDSMCLACDNFHKAVKETYISCPEIRDIDNPKINTVLPLSVETKQELEMDRVQEAKEEIKKEEVKAEEEIKKVKEDGNKSVWDNSIALTKQPVFSLPKRAFLTEIK